MFSQVEPRTTERGPSEARKELQLGIHRTTNENEEARLPRMQSLVYQLSATTFVPPQRRAHLKTTSRSSQNPRIQESLQGLTKVFLLRLPRAASTPRPSITKLYHPRGSQSPRCNSEPFIHHHPHLPMAHDNFSMDPSSTPPLLSSS